MNEFENQDATNTTTVTADELAQFDNDFNEAQEAERQSDVPDGKYKVQVSKIALTKTKEKQQNCLKWQLRVVEGPHANRILFRSNMLVTKENFSWLKADLKVVGLNPPLERISDLPNRLSEILDLCFEVTVKSRTGSNGRVNQNVYLNKRIEGPPPEMAGDDDFNGQF